MAWSIFSNGGGKGAAATWAKDLLIDMGAPDTPGNEQFIYDWEVSEGGGGKYNPLNQGPVPNVPSLTSTGQQYGGGAADYVSYDAGLTGAVDYLNMPNYTAVKAALLNNDPVAARSALIQSPWASSHYGYGSAFSSEPLPGTTSQLLDTSGNAVTTSFGHGNPWAGIPGGQNPFTGSGGIGSLFGDTAGTLLSDIFGSTSAKALMVRGALIVFGAIIMIIGVNTMTKGGVVNQAKQVAKTTPGLR